MVFGQLPGIFWDPREPIPPHLRHLQQNWPGTIGAGIVHADYRRGRHGQQQLRQQADEAFGNAGAGVPTRDDGFLPPLAVSVDASITHDTAKVVVTQLFDNNTNSLIPKAGYTFPLPPGSTVVDFSCRVGRDKVLIGKVRPKANATQRFEEAVRQNQTAGLLDQNSQEVFTTTLGNVPANTRLRAVLSFIVLLKHDRLVDNREARMTFTLPTYIAPRYGPPPGDVGYLLGRSSSLKKLSVSVNILAAADILSLTSAAYPNADIQLGVATSRRWADFVANRETRDVRCATVRLPDETVYLDRDFTLDISTASTAVSERPFACLEKHPDFPCQSALMLTVPPKFLIGPSREYAGGEIIFIADRSGSMTDKIDALKAAMAFFLAALPLGCSFNIWSFGSHFSSLWPRSLEYNPSNRRAAELHVASQFRADLGGTELLSALKGVLASQGGFANTDIIVLTDGEIWGLDQTIRLVKQTRLQTEGRIRFFSLGIGNAVSHELVEGIAKAGGGYAEVIQTASQGGWEGSMLSVLEAAKERHVFPSAITLDWDNETDEDQSHNGACQSPHDISNLSPFMRNRIFKLLQTSRENAIPKSVWLHRTQPGIDSEPLEVPIAVLQTPDTTIHKFAARALLGDLERGESQMHVGPDAPARGSEEELEQTRIRGENLGCKWSLVSKWTSFVAVEGVLEDSQGDTFMDGDQEETPGTAGRALNLLRPRGDQRMAPQIGGSAEHADSDNESSDSEDDDSDTVPGRDGGDRGDDSGNSDDDYGQGQGGQGHGNFDRGDADRRSREDDHDSHSREGSSSGPESGTGPPAPRQGNREANSRAAVVHDVNILNPSQTINFRNYQLNDPTWSPPAMGFELHYENHVVKSKKRIMSKIGEVSSRLKSSTYQKEGVEGETKTVRKSAVKSVTKSTANHGTATKSSSTRDLPSMSSAISGAELEITAPQNNLSAAPAIKFAIPVSTSDPVEKAKGELIKLLLPLQAASGEFLAQAHSWDGKFITMESILGTSFEAFVIASTAECPKIIPSLAIKDASLLDAVVRTASVIALLDLHFQSCEDLWRLLRSKAADYLRSKLSSTEWIQVVGSVKVLLGTVTFHLGDDPSTHSTPSLHVQVAAHMVGVNSYQTASPLRLPQHHGMALAGYTAQFPAPAQPQQAQPTMETAVPHIQPVVTLSSRKRVGLTSPMPKSQDVSRSEHDDLIRRIAAERQTRSWMAGGEEIEVPEDI